MFFLPSLDRLFAASFRRLIVLIHVCSRCRARTVALESTMQLQQWRSVPHSIVSNFILRSKIYIHPIYLSHIHTRASFRTTAAAATAKPAYRGCIAPLPDPNTLYKMWITIIFKLHTYICFWKMMYVGWNRRLWRKRESKCLALLQLCCILVDIACNLQLDGPEKDHVRRYLGVRRICHCALLLFAWRLFRRHSGIGGGAERHLRT